MIYRNGFLIADVETGGLSAKKNPITEIAIVGLDYEYNKTIEYSSLIKPYDENLIYEKKAAEYTGISKELCEKEGKDIKQVFEEVTELVKSLKVGKYQKPYLVGHNLIEFDFDFLNEFFLRFNKDIFELVDTFLLDTLKLSRMKYGKEEVGGFTLEKCCERAGIQLIDAHRGMNDTKATADLFINLWSSFEGNQGSSKSIQKSEKITFLF